MPKYESTFIARQDLSKQDITKLTDQFSAIVTNGGGKVVKNEYWGLRGLAYPIKKTRRGHYTMLAIDADAAVEKELQRVMGLNEDVIRSMTVRVDEIQEGPSAIMQRSFRDEADDVVIDVAPIAAAE